MAKTELFKCAEKDGFYSVTDQISEQDIIEFAQAIIAKRFQRGVSIKSNKDSVEFLRSQIGHYEHEVFVALFLDNKNRIITLEEISKGTINQTAVYPREVAKRALHHNAAAIIFAHNHPSGDTTPSKSDIDITAKLVATMDLIEVRTLDHIVLSNAESTSLAQLGHV